MTLTYLHTRHVIVAGNHRRNLASFTAAYFTYFKDTLKEYAHNQKGESVA